MRKQLMGVVLVVVPAQAFTLLHPNCFTVPHFRDPILPTEGTGRLVDVLGLKAAHVDPRGYKPQFVQ